CSQLQVASLLQLGHGSASAVHGRRPKHREANDLILLIYALAIDAHMHRKEHLSKCYSRIKGIIEKYKFDLAGNATVEQGDDLEFDTDSVELQYISEHDDDPKSLWA
ncbi:hypothetical protein CABS01_16779, partial [Colletotrichum abscissum]|uniref:uncharacterized protein n=1 Tax=Colletotrichum abscissum TaxID=1671311 RepID=UPI0027D5EAD0